MGFPSLSAGRRRPACRRWKQGREACVGSARRLLPGGRTSVKRRVRALFRQPLVAGVGDLGGAAVRFALGLAGEGDGERDYSLRDAIRPYMST